MTRSAVWPTLLVPLAIAALAPAGDRVLTAQDRAGREVSANAYRPTLARPEFMEPFLEHLEPGTDGFPQEREAAELAARLRELGARLRSGPGRAADLSDWLLAADFRGGPLIPGVPGSR